MQTISSPISSPKTSLASFCKTSPPSVEGPANSPPVSCDGVNLSAKSQSKKPASSLWAKAALGGLAVVAVAGCPTSPALSQAINETAPAQVEKAAENFESAPVEMLRMDNGEVVFNLGINDQVVNPDLVRHDRVPGADHSSVTQRDESICKQAMDIGGECQGENIALVTTPHGTLIIEQNESNTVDIYSQQGGHTNIKVEAGGVDVSTHQGSAYFANDGSIRHH